MLNNKKKLLGEIKFLSDFIFKNKGKDFIIYFSSSLLVSGIGFILLPLFTHAMSPYEMGVYGTFITFKTLLVSIFIYGTNTLLTTKYYKINESERKVLLSNIIYFITILSFVISIITILSIKPLTSLLEIDELIIFISLIVSYFSAILAVFMKLYQLKSQSKRYAIFSILKSIFIISFSLLLVFKFKFTLYGRIMGVFFPSVIIPIYILYKNKHELAGFSYSKNLDILKTGYSFVIMGISGFVVNMSDKIFINNLVSVSDTGIYTVGYKFGMVISLIHNAFSKAWVSYFYQNVKTKRKKVFKIQIIYLFSLFIILIIFNIIIKLIFNLFIDPEYLRGYIYVVIISISYFFNAIRGIFNGYLIYFEKFRVIRNIAIFESGINIILNYCLIKYLQTIGAAIGTLISFLLGAIITLIFVWLNYQKGFEKIENNK